MAVQASPTSILVSWTVPASGGASRTGYRIFYQTGGGSEQSVLPTTGATSHTLTTGLQSGVTYSISIVTLSSTLPSARVGPETVTFKCELLFFKCMLIELLLAGCVCVLIKMNFLPSF